MQLRETLTRYGIGYTELGQALTQATGSGAGKPYGIAAMSRLINHKEWPKATPKEALQQQIEAYLTARGVPGAEIEVLWTAGGAAAQGDQTTPNKREGNPMLPRKSSLSPQAKKHFKLLANPLGDVERDEDMVLTPDLRYAREALMGAARNGGFVALVGESGSGKSTLWEECEEQIRRNQYPITVIRPPIVGMDIEATKGTPLRARNILHFLMDAVDRDAKRQSSLSWFTVTVQQALAARHAEGRRFVLVIDDAHRLNKHTMNHLKDFYELKSGRARLLSIILLGQLPLANRLDPLNPEIIQITQRCELLMLRPLGDNLQAYLESRLAAAGLEYSALFAADAVDAIRERLSTREGTGRKQHTLDQTYPLAVNNLVVAALNLAAELGSAQVTADVVREV